MPVSAWLWLSTQHPGWGNASGSSSSTEPMDMDMKEDSVEMEVDEVEVNELMEVDPSPAVWQASAPHPLLTVGHCAGAGVGDPHCRDRVPSALVLAAQLP